MYTESGCKGLLRSNQLCMPMRSVKSADKHIVGAVSVQVALQVLKLAGYSQVTTMMDGQQALDEIHRCGGANAFNIILTDLHMPQKVAIAAFLLLM